MITVAPAPLSLVVDIVNGWSGQIRDEAGDADEPLPSLAAVLHAHVWDATLVGGEQLSALAERMQGVFTLQPGRARLAAINSLVRRLAPLPSLTSAGPRWAIPQAARELEASLLLAIVEHARDDPSLRRLSSCAAHGCIDVYVDSSQAHVRRYCSLTCQNRAKAAAYRRRHATARGRAGTG